MLPSMKKVHSVDYTSSQRQHGVGASPASSTSNRNAPLMHSVSIVVELAVEKQPTEKSLNEEEEFDLEKSIDITEAMVSKSNPQIQTIEPVASKTIPANLIGDNDEEEEEDVDDEESASCLSTDLARKVVIVDEADKILQFRAQSAEPRVGASGVGAVFAPTKDGSRIGKIAFAANMEVAESEPMGVRPIVFGSSKLATMRSNTVAGRDIESSSMISGNPRKWHRSSTQTCPCSSTSGAGLIGELAEHGELAKLGMRRYTHHQVSYHLPTEGSGGPSGEQWPRAVCSAQLEFRDCQHKKSVCGNILAPSHENQEQQLDGGDQSVVHRQPHASAPSSSSPPLVSQEGLSLGAKVGSGTVSIKNWPQRRQSLQINLLGVSSCVCKSLTQEELRGEREFNEQVRCSKSPDSFATTLHQQYPTPYQQQLSSNSSPTQVLECQSQETVLERTGLAAADQTEINKKIVANSSQETCETKASHQQSPNLPASQLAIGARLPAPIQKPTRQPTAAQVQRRRVSFGSIDPIDRADASSFPFAFHSSLHHPDNTKTVASQLSDANLDNRNANPTNLPPRFSASTNQSRHQTGCLKSTEKQKRHSLASSNITPLGGDEILNRKFTEISDRQPLAKDQRGIIRTTKKMNDHKSMKANEMEVDETKADLKSPFVPTAGTQMEKFSTTLDGREITDETRITSSTTTSSDRPPPPSNTQVKDGSRVQSIMANAKLRQEEFARLLEEHEQIVKEINRVETKISIGQTGIQQPHQEKHQ